MRPGVTVVIPTTPLRRELLSRAVASVFGQELLPHSVVIETDLGRRGPGATRNQGLSRVDTEWVAFLDDDDELYPDHLKACLALAEYAQADVVYPLWATEYDGIVLRDPFGLAGQPFDARRLRQDNYIPVTTLCRTEAVRAVGGFPTEDAPTIGQHRCESWGLWLRLADAGARFEPLHAVTWCYRWHQGQHHGQVWSYF